MAFDSIGTGMSSWTEAFHQYQDEVMTKIKKGATQESVTIGSQSFTQSEWKKVMEGIDQQIEDIREEQKNRFEKQEREAEAQKIYEAAAAGKTNPVENLREKAKVPYEHLAKDGMIEYNGVVFICDETTNSICLGDVSDKENTLVIPLEGGGCLKVNRDNLDELQNAIGMFSPEDINRILRAIAQDNRVREKMQEVEETKNGKAMEQDQD